jgi:hypothetical protein
MPAVATELFRMTLRIIGEFNGRTGVMKLVGAFSNFVENLKIPTHFFSPLKSV